MLGGDAIGTGAGTGSGTATSTATNTSTTTSTALAVALALPLALTLASVLVLVLVLILTRVLLTQVPYTFMSSDYALNSFNACCDYLHACVLLPLASTLHGFVFVPAFYDPIVID